MFKILGALRILRASAKLSKAMNRLQSSDLFEVSEATRAALLELYPQPNEAFVCTESLEDDETFGVEIDAELVQAVLSKKDRTTAAGMSGVSLTRTFNQSASTAKRRWVTSRRW